jgi:hypothetical protein
MTCLCNAQDLLPVLQSLVFERRVELLKAKRADGSEEQRYRLVGEERSTRLVGLQDEEEAVLALIEKAGYGTIAYSENVISYGNFT